MRWDEIDTARFQRPLEGGEIAEDRMPAFELKFVDCADAHRGCLG
jgi:hypothetical protein